MSDASVHVTEFERLRQEIDNRTTLAYGLIAVQLATAGAGLSILDAHPEILLVLASVSCFLWLFWMDHAGQIFKIAAYIALRLTPEIQRAAPGGLGWERFVRDLDAGGDRAARALFGPGAEGSAGYQVHTTGSIHRYTAMLFGATPPVFVAIYLATQGDGGLQGVAAAVTGALVLLLWASVVRRYRVYLAMIAVIDRAIATAQAAN